MSFRNRRDKIHPSCIIALILGQLQVLRMWKSLKTNTDHLSSFKMREMRSINPRATSCLLMRGQRSIPAALTIAT